MSTSVSRRGLLFAVPALAVCGLVASQAVAAPGSPYAPYAFLIGAWNVGPRSGGPAGMVERFRWGPGQSYIWFSAAMLTPAGEQPHFEGLLMWNGMTRKLDMLLAADLSGGRVQEQGVVSVEPDGSVVRQITAIYSEGARPIGLPIAGPQGASQQFRQVFKADGEGRVLTSAMRHAAQGWAPTFPGADDLVMIARPEA